MKSKMSCGIRSRIKVKEISVLFPCDFWMDSSIQRAGQRFPIHPTAAGM